ncbi:MAG: sn-glycerol-3-phosphate ABC transporter ATP-binding protein UgpC [Phormidesmis sp. RL_2_1]|nr:sn-glycerol-3-phosphate ABC transporter ATP-binding protein UgpC [Phormidesmis sp. RL_2_1]
MRQKARSIPKRSPLPHPKARPPVLEHINLTVNDGEFMVLVGPSGCGKSTLLRLISGLETLTEGEIWVGDRLVNTLAPKQRDIAMVFQSYALYPHLSVYNNLAFGLRRSRPRKSNTEIAQRVRSVAKMLQIEELLSRLPKQLSGGQKQRVALGRAMARSPQVFLMDEPLSNLDAKLRTETRAQIVSLQRQLATTTIYVTHDQTEAMTMGDRIAVMNQGKIQQVAPPLALYHHPATRFVAAFIGSPPMNFLPVTVKASQLVHPLFTIALPPAWQAAIAAYQNQSLTLGIRPEHIEIGQKPGATSAIITQLEALGSETYVTATLSDTPANKTPSNKPSADTNSLQIRLSAEQNISLGSILQISFPPAKLHLFDPSTDANIRPSPHPHPPYSD